MATLTKSWTYLGQQYIGTSGGDLYVRLYARYTQQDVVNNRTYVEYNASTYYVNSTYIQDLAGVIGCSGTGTAWKQTACTYITTGEKGWVTNGAWVTHENDGTKSVSATAKLTFPNWGWSGEVTATASLPTIPRASQPSINTHPTSVKEITIGESVTIHMNRKANFTHKVTASFGKKIELITESCTDNVAWNGFTVEKFASEIPNSASGVLTITVDTFNGQTLIGTKSAQVTATLPSTVIPTIQSLSASAVSDSVPTAWNLYVQSKSKCKITVNNALGVHGSTIKSYLIKEGNTIVANADTGTTVLFADAGTHTFTATVTDSRGRTASKEISINVEPYELPTIQAVLSQRCLQDGTLNEDGTYARCLSLFSISSCGDKNVANAKVYYKKTDESVWSSGTPFTSNVAITIGNGSIDADFAYDLKYELTDSLTAEPTIIYDMVSTSFSTMDYKKGGRGIAIGKASEKEAFEVAMTTYFEKPIHDMFNTQITNGLALPKTVDANTTLDHEIVTNINTPSNVMMYVVTYFYDIKSATTNRMQLAYPYNTDGSVYHRYFNGGSWTAWKRNITEEENGGDFIRIRVAGAHPEVTNDAIVPFDSISDQQGNSFTLTQNGHIRVGANVKAVRIHSSVGAKCGVNNRGWSNLRLNGAWKSQTLVYGTYLTLVIDDVLNVKEGDVITVNVAETSGVNVDGMNSYITVEKVR